MTNSKVIIALDFKSKEETLEFLDKFGDEKLYVKVGMEAFYGQGIDLITEINRRGHSIFLDLKCHDIPNTVKSAMRQLAKLGVDMVNVHASGGIAMMKACLEATHVLGIISLVATIPCYPVAIIGIVKFAKKPAEGYARPVKAFVLGLVGLFLAIMTVFNYLSVAAMLVI